MQLGMAMDGYWALLEFERTFRGQPWIDFTQEHTEIPIFVVCAYLALVFYGPPCLQGWGVKLELRGTVIVWNSLLAIFSTIGAARTVPHLLKHLRRDGFAFTACADPKDWYLDGAVGLWVCLFIFSKIPELLDTVFLVLRQRKVIFLHWFHHCTVLLYCWHSYHHRVAPGLWFAAMNFSVHSVMYTYYALMAARLHGLAAPFASLITSVQIMQMAAGALVTGTAAQQHRLLGRESCHVVGANYRLGLGMYCSYFVLFFALFWNKYVATRCCGTKRQPSAAARQGSGEKLCGVDLRHGDTTGRFNDGLGGVASKALREAETLQQGSEKRKGL